MIRVVDGKEIVIEKVPSNLPVSLWKEQKTVSKEPSFSDRKMVEEMLTQRKEELLKEVNDEVASAVVRQNNVERNKTLSVGTRPLNVFG